VFEQIQNYWRTAYPAAFGTPWPELRGGVHGVDPRATSGALCAPSAADVTGNSFYCSGTDGIVYDTGVLTPVLAELYGSAGLLASFAHEMGHAVAARAGVATGDALLRELQADCFAGNVLAGTNTDLLAGAAALLDFGDRPTVRRTDTGAHGLAIDRAMSVRVGMLDGPTACRAFTAGTVPIVLGRFPAQAAAPDRFAHDTDVLGAARRSLAAIRPQIGWTDPAADDVETAGQYGQFGVAAVGVLAAAHGEGLSPTAAGCLTGAWTAAVLGGPDDSLGGRLGDPDEALGMVRTRRGATNDELAGFVDGFAGRCR
jgi:hypothetical protein